MYSSKTYELYSRDSKQLGPTVKNGSENNHSAMGMVMASLGGQGHQQEIPPCQENGDKEGDKSESVESELEHSGKEEVDEHSVQN